ncbi:BTAD domain-containing putative transcriptional regulator [Geodermatophilus sp. SYSU D00691]
MRFAVIGPLEVRTPDAAPVAVPGAKERLLLAVLAAGAPAVVGTDRIVECLWDGAPPPTARKSLQAHVVRLRSALEPGRPKGSSGRYVVRRGPGYALAVDRADLDALHFGDLAGRGRARLAGGATDEAESLLGAALGLWRGDPYGDWPDAPFAEAERRRLGEVRSAALAALLEARLAQGRHAEVLPELRRMVTEEPLQEEWWRLLMLALYRSGRQADALGAARQARALLAEELGAAPGPALRAMEAAVLAHDPALDAPSGPVVVKEPPRAAAGGCPYKGLAAYQPDDAPLFHGRDRMVRTLVARLVDAELVVVSGPSGAGKSSVVRAGLVPALAAGAVPGSDRWRPVVVTVGADPVDLLAELTGETPPDRPVVLVCDQAEQLWAPTVDAAERTAFLDAVLGLLDDGVVVRCVLVLRGDSVGRLAEHAALAERLGGAIALVPPLREPELRDVVVEPARAVGLTVDPELVDAVVHDVLGRSAALPLLSTALVGTWERRRGDRLDLAGYLAAGGVAGALTRVAEEAHRALEEGDRRLARAVLVRLADTDEGGAYVRRTVPLAEVRGAGPDAAARERVVETFVARRLLTVDADRLEVAHEALFTAWPRLARWLEEDAAGRAVRRHLAPAAREWAGGGRPPEELYRGARLAAALDWAADPDASPTAVEEEFLAASQRQAEAELAEAREQVARERRGRRRTRRLAAGLAAVLVLALVATVLAVRFQRVADTRAGEAERIARVADANRLAALSAAEDRLDLSLLTAAQAVRLAGTREAEDQLLGTLLVRQRAIGVVALPRPFRDAVVAGGTLFLDDGTHLARWPVGSAGGPATALRGVGTWGGWLVADGSPAEDLLVAAGTDIYDNWWLRLLSADGETRQIVQGNPDGRRPVAVAFTGDGSRVNVFLETAGDPGSWSVTEFDVATGAARVTVSGGALPGAAAVGADVSDDGRTAVVFDPSSGSGGAVLVDLADGRQVPLQRPGRGVAGTGYRALGTSAVQMWADGQVTIYGPDGSPVQQVGEGGGSVLDVVRSPDGRWAATVGSGGVVTLWDVDGSSGEWRAGTTAVAHAGDVWRAEVADGGRRLLTLGADHRLVAWDMTPTGGFGAVVEPGGDVRLAGRPHTVEPGRLVVVPSLRPAGSAAGGATVAVTFLDPRTGEVLDEVPVGEVEQGAQPERIPLAVSPDHRNVAISTGRSTTVVDTGTRRPVGEPIVVPAGEGEPFGRPVACLAWVDPSTLALCVPGDSITGSSMALLGVDAFDGRPGARVQYAVSFDFLALSPDGRVLAASNLRRGGLQDGQVISIARGDLGVETSVNFDAPDVTTDMSFSPDGERLALTGRSGDLYLIDVASWEGTQHLITGGAALEQVEWLPDGRTVALLSSTGTVSLFDVERGRSRGPAIAASTDGGPSGLHLMPVTSAELVVLGGDRPGRRWPLDPMAWVEQACAVVGRDLTRTEWERYLPDRPYRPTCSDLG